MIVTLMIIMCYTVRCAVVESYTILPWCVQLTSSDTKCLTREWSSVPNCVFCTCLVTMSRMRSWGDANLARRSSNSPGGGNSTAATRKTIVLVTSMTSYLTGRFLRAICDWVGDERNPTAGPRQGFQHNVI